MTTPLLKRSLVSEATSLRIAQAITALAALLIMVVGGHKLADLELTESQLLVGVLFTLSFQCAILVMLLDLKRKPV